MLSVGKGISFLLLTGCAEMNRGRSFECNFITVLGERMGAACVGILVYCGQWGGEEKKHTCLQINWFGQEASKEELCVVKQACGEAEMSQQKHSHDHRADHDAVHICI